MEYEQGETLALQAFDWVSPFGVVFLYTLSVYKSVLHSMSSRGENRENY
jgi:hypothetical protein